MAIAVLDADDYIRMQCIDSEDWFDSEEVRKQRLLLTAKQMLLGSYRGFTIPDSAVYEYANELAIAFNDVNRLRQHGIQSYSLTGVAEVTYKESTKTGLDGLITDKVLRLITDANPEASFSRRALKWTVL
ncbi:hypothetical protein D3P07_00800 [Paenibacillus sp. 1011MAR3C5]|uniref:hypothetical protein n=1 Tax=Paenibacillus sp. 1011MAR3C5 TaxID=1675787 RepID=UPI000E6D17E2|nr:hypothetical protein [Paenibacillus sp. 1011MAR3C5]RJE90679.1 hypothetical protein D3P07_00800 [Paenibacillus sp. 1011MAR3C5]